MKFSVPQTRSPSHRLLPLTRGEATMSVGSETYKNNPNDGLVMPAGQVLAIGKVN